MRHWLRHWFDFEKQFQRARQLQLFLDFDGTLAPIVSRPDQATLTASRKTLLRRMAGTPGIRLAIVSGRSLEDLFGRVKLPELWYVGNHGSEIRSPKGKTLRAYSHRDERIAGQLEREILRKLEDLPGLVVENKGPILAVHYRKVAAQRVAAALREVRRIAGLLVPRGVLRDGHKVLEVHVRKLPHKGKAVERILSACPAGTRGVCLGDDRTDQDAFRAVRRRGVSVHIGKTRRRTRADYFLRNPREVWQALRRLRTTWLRSRKNRV